MADDRLLRYAAAASDVGNQARKGVDLRFGEVLPRRHDLDSDGMQVRLPMPGVPSGVAFLDRPADGAVLVDEVAHRRRRARAREVQQSVVRGSRSAGVVHHDGVGGAALPPCGVVAAVALDELGYISHACSPPRRRGCSCLGRLPAIGTALGICRLYRGQLSLRGPLELTHRRHPQRPLSPPSRVTAPPSPEPPHATRGPRRPTRPAGRGCCTQLDNPPGQNVANSGSAAMPYECCSSVSLATLSMISCLVWSPVFLYTERMWVPTVLSEMPSSSDMRFTLYPSDR